MNTNEKNPLSDFADVERHHMVPGIFQVCKRNKKSQAIDIRFEFSDGYLDVVAGRAPRPFDAVLLCAILNQIAQNKKYVRPESKNPLGQELREKMKLMDSAKQDPCLAFNTSFRKLSKLMGIGWHGEITIKRLKEALRRLFTVTFFLEYQKDGKKKESGFHLISWIELEEEKDDTTLAIAVNPVLAEALIFPGRYARIDMDILKTLEPNQQLIFIMLSNAVDPGKARSFTSEELREMLYGQSEGIEKTTLEKQRTRAKKTAFSIAPATGWEIEEKDGKVWIQRPADWQKKKTVKE